MFVRDACWRRDNFVAFISAAFKKAGRQDEDAAVFRPLGELFSFHASVGEGPRNMFAWFPVHFVQKAGDYAKQVAILPVLPI
ncbi:hypothetical protein FHS76_002463 [Ochrobactrum daejeonense]|uniref:Uncharacterized protein n=1 Tax=Brucella daejeonensis TaxID=659015 RepID=A0A7W9AXS8_9HYPH|nr:hypothetical protein [Brucella daejeonensis]MBB5702579.1 hypothetical protein [Brucella daejeonensis]